MKQLAVTLTMAAALLAGVGFGFPRAARADGDLDHINVTYRGGPLLQHAKVATLFWGTEWQKGSGVAYLNGFFKALFDDGRYVANLSQYSTGNWTIENGEWVGSASATAAAPTTVTDAQLRDLIRAGISRGVVPAPTPDTLYFVFVPGSVHVKDSYGEISDGNFDAYHDYARGDGFAYAVVIASNPQQATKAASHELAEAITDPQVDRNATLGWYDDQNGEIGDIPNALFAAGRISRADWLDTLKGADGTEYTVQKEWSNRDGAPVAFAEKAITTPPTFGLFGG
jgi:hypothetical protein